MGSKIGVLKIAASRIGISYEEYSQHIENNEKWCMSCSKWINKSQFGIDNSRGDGLTSKCFICRRVKVHKNTKGRDSAFKGQQHTESAKTKMSKAHSGENNHNWKGGITPKKERNKDAILARRSVNHAIEAGRLESPKNLPCFDCGNPAKEYDHFRGYNKPNWFDIQAVCTKCHHQREQIRRK